MSTASTAPVPIQASADPQKHGKHDENTPQKAGGARTPSYRRHKGSGQGVVTIDGKDIYLGVYGTKASRNAYDRVIGEWLANGRRLPKSDSVTVAKIIEGYWQHAQGYYRRQDGTQTNEVAQMRYALRPLNHLYGPTLMAEFGPLALKAVRQLMIDGYRHPKFGPQERLCRTNINARIKRICRMVKWAVEQ